MYEPLDAYRAAFLFQFHKRSFFRHISLTFLSDYDRIADRKNIHGMQIRSDSVRGRIML